MEVLLPRLDHVLRDAGRDPVAASIERAVDGAARYFAFTRVTVVSPATLLLMAPTHSRGPVLVKSPCDGAVQSPHGQNEVPSKR